ncbi:MAG: hypothetical protein WBB29_05225 [Geitlerinemataceae cyanobacterium]
MCLTWLISLTFAIAAGFFSFWVREEVESLFSFLIAVFCLLVSLILAPLFVQLMLVGVLLTSAKSRSIFGIQE